MLENMENPNQAKPVESNSAEQLESEAQQQPQQNSMPGENADGGKLEEKLEVSESEKVEDKVAGSENSEEKTVVVNKYDEPEETNSEETEKKPEETTVVAEEIAESTSKPESEETSSEIPKTEVHKFDFTEITRSIQQLNVALSDLELSVCKLNSPLQMSFQKIRITLEKCCEEMKASESTTSEVKSVPKSALAHVDVLVKSESGSQHESITGGIVLENVPKREESKMDIHETESEGDKSEKISLPKVEISEIKAEHAIEETNLDTSIPEDAEKIIVDKISSVDENALKS